MRMTPNDKNEGDNAKSLMIKISTFEFIFFSYILEDNPKIS